METLQRERIGGNQEQRGRNEVGFAEVLGVTAVLGITAFAAKKFWDKKGPEIKGKLDTASSEVIDACIAKGKDAIMSKLGLSKAESGPENRQEVRPEASSQERVWRDLDPEVKERVKASFATGDVIDVDYTEVPKGESIDPDGVDRMSDQEVFELTRKISEDKTYREDYFGIFIEESRDIIGEGRSAFSMSKDEEYTASRAALKKFFAGQKDGSINRDASGSRRKAQKNLADILVEFSKK